MNERPLLLDLFCGAGGAASGYARAGFDIVGIDRVQQKRYPYSFIQDDAMKVLERIAAGKTWRGYRARDFEVIHASPPCQRNAHPDLIGETLQLLYATKRMFVIESVVRAPLSPFSITLCGLNFGLEVFRHLRFESNVLLFSPEHIPHGTRRIGRDGYVCVDGHGGQLAGWPGHGQRRTVPKDHRTKAAWSRAMGIDWMTRDELSQAIPPAYTHHIGCQLLAAIRNRQ